MKLSKIGFSMECFIDKLSRFSSTKCQNLPFGWLGTRHFVFRVFFEISWFFSVHSNQLFYMNFHLWILFLVTPCLVVALQSYAEQDLIKKHPMHSAGSSVRSSTALCFFVVDLFSVTLTSFNPWTFWQLILLK